MALVILLATFAAAMATGFLLKWRGVNWFVAWVLSSLVMPASLYIKDLIAPTGWFEVAAIFGTLYGIGLGGGGVFAAWLIQRQSQPQRDDAPAP